MFKPEHYFLGDWVPQWVRTSFQFVKFDTVLFYYKLMCFPSQFTLLSTYVAIIWGWHASGFGWHINQSGANQKNMVGLHAILKFPSISPSLPPCCPPSLPHLDLLLPNTARIVPIVAESDLGTALLVAFSLTWTVGRACLLSMCACSMHGISNDRHLCEPWFAWLMQTWFFLVTEWTFQLFSFWKKAGYTKVQIGREQV